MLIHLKDQKAKFILVFVKKKNLRKMYRYIFFFKLFLLGNIKIKILYQLINCLAIHSKLFATYRLRNVYYTIHNTCNDVQD